MLRMSQLWRLDSEIRQPQSENRSVSTEVRTLVVHSGNRVAFHVAPIFDRASMGTVALAPDSLARGHRACRIISCRMNSSICRLKSWSGVSRCSTIEM